MTFQLAHSATGGGGSLDQIALAVGLVMLGLAFLVQKSLDRRVSIVLVVLGLIAFIGSFTFLKGVGGEKTIVVQGQEVTESELQDAVSAICTARNSADDNPDNAYTNFIERAHVRLHIIVAAVEDEDRELAARILEVKTAVEEEFVGTPDREKLVEDLQDLLEVTVEALNLLQIEATEC